MRPHHISSASQQVSRHPSQDSKVQPSSSSREVEQYRLKGVKSPPIRESDQHEHRPETQSPPTPLLPSKQGHSSSSYTTAYPSSSSRKNTREQTPPRDSSMYRSSSRKNAQEYTPPSDTSPHRSSSRKNTQEYTPPSDDQRRPSGLSQVHAPDDRGRREREREREKEKERRKASDSEHEAFSGKGELHPTFSPAIVRTPKYYSDRTSTPSNNTPTKPSVHRSSDDPGVPPRGTAIPPLRSMLQENLPSFLSPLIGATPRPSSTTISGLDKAPRGELSSSSSSSSPSTRDRSSRSHSRNHSRSSSLSKVDDKPHRSLQRTDTLTSRAMSPNRYEVQPQPPVYYSGSSSSMQQPSRSVTRSHTYPSLDPVSENPYPPIRRDSRDGRESRNPPTSISRASDAVKDLARSNSRTLGRNHTEPRSSYNLTRTTSPSRALSPTRALSPPRSSTTSRSSSRAPSRAHTPTSSGVIAPPVPVPPLPTDATHRYRTSSSGARKVRVRQGFWNRRGDCVTADGRYYIRAPPEHQNPPDLSHLHQYHFSSYDGRTIPYGRRMKEYPDSMSKRGQPPRYPFECVRGSFVITGNFTDAFLQFLKYIEVNESDIRTPEFPSPH